MSKEETAKLLETMLNDSGVAHRVAGGDFADLADGDLTEAERALLAAAGSELQDDVAGFSNAFLKIGDIQGGATRGTNPHDVYMKMETEKVRFALDYLGKGIYKF